MLAAPSGLTRSRFSPAQIESSLSWIRSFSTPPNTIPPRRPLPMGSASTHFEAGCLYQSRFALSAALAPQGIAKRAERARILRLDILTGPYSLKKECAAKERMKRTPPAVRFITELSSEEEVVVPRLIACVL